MKLPLWVDPLWSAAVLVCGILVYGLYLLLGGWKEARDEQRKEDEG